MENIGKIRFFFESEFERRLIGWSPRPLAAAQEQFRRFILEINLVGAGWGLGVRHDVRFTDAARRARWAAALQTCFSTALTDMPNSCAISPCFRCSRRNNMNTSLVLSFNSCSAATT